MPPRQGEPGWQRAADARYEAAVAAAAGEYHKLIDEAVSALSSAMSSAAAQLATATRAAETARRQLVEPAQLFFDQQVASADTAARAILGPAQAAYVKAYEDANALYELIAPVALQTYNRQVEAAQHARQAAQAEHQRG